MKRPIPIGIEFYKRMIEEEFYYVDKTLLIKEIMDAKATVTLFTRPRRFGKTLALSMLRTYFEDERDAKGEHVDNCHYFDGKKILSCGEQYTAKMGRYPVIHMSLKSAKQPDFETAYHVLKDNIQDEFRRHMYVFDGDGAGGSIATGQGEGEGIAAGAARAEGTMTGSALDDMEKEKFLRIYRGEAEAGDYATALAFLSHCLKKYHGRNTIILIDEYDVPLENAYFEGFYDRIVGFIRSLFESALKTNGDLEFGIVTGCLRISKESIFTGLNNLEVVSVLNRDYAEYYGFTPAEVEAMLADYGLADCMEEARHWYDGYLFGTTEVYNPWSVINYVKSKTIDRNAFPKPYWSNTSSNSIIRELVEEADMGVRREIEELINGGTIEKQVHEDITYGDIHESQDNLWNFLFFTGYLKKIEEDYREESIYLRMAIPNAEIRSVYRNTITTWFDRKVKALDRSVLLRAMENGDCEALEDFISEQLGDTISFYDYAENYYHGFLVGLLKGVGKYYVQSNRESGTGRPDIVMQTPSVRGRAFILELKVAREFRQMEGKCAEAIEQARRENYRAELERVGFSNITVYGICFYQKECMVRRAEG